MRAFAARSDDAHSSSVVSTDAPLISTLPVTDSERTTPRNVQL
jgi:hypothetical protein